MNLYNIKLPRECIQTEPDTLKVSIHKLLATHLCDHTESKVRPCGNCWVATGVLLKPICRFAYFAAMGNRPDDKMGKMDGYASLGAALDQLFGELGVKDEMVRRPEGTVEEGQFQPEAPKARTQGAPKGVECLNPIDGTYGGFGVDGVISPAPSPILPSPEQGAE